ncbi:MAG: (2Fe-2S)-binding protein [Acidobacteria bacterium]|nr:(2Fe-2S)-binding protein [Acidobacteriota bacterium]
MSNELIDHLGTFSESDWLAAVEELLPLVHEVDRNALQIWFRFYPLSLKRFVDAGESREETLHGIAMQGDFELDGQIATSHHFLFGHRFWPKVKCVIEKLAEDFKGKPETLTDLIKEVSIVVAEKKKVDRTLTNAIAAVGLMTLTQVGLDAFKAASGDVEDASKPMSKSPDAIVAERAKDDSQGMFGFLRTIDKQFSIAYSGAHASGKFTLLCDEEIASASQKDSSRNWKEMDERCWEGPIPIECTAASCGTCWVGVLGGQEKLTEVGRRERRQMKVFGYNQPEEERPFIRLACQARASGNVTIVVPPWNAAFGKKVSGNVDELELEPVTTSAKALRDTIATAVNGE